METMYKIYLDAIKANSIKEVLDIDTRQQYPLYAWTTDKKLAKEFLKLRKDDLFIMKDTKMRKEEVVKFGNLNKITELDVFQYDRITDKYSGGFVEEVEIVSPWFERENVDCIVDIGLDEDDLAVDYRALDEEYIKALRTLSYCQFFDIIHMINDCYSSPNIYFDEFEIYFDRYGHLLK